MIVFHYKPEEGIRHEIVKRPVADVWFKKGNRWIEAHPYIDSGADVTLIPLSLGKFIGFLMENEKIEEIGGIRGSVPVIYKNWQVKIGDKILDILLAWALTDEVPPLLGRKDIFDAFEITFNQKKETIIFREI